VPPVGERERGPIVTPDQVAERLGLSRREVYRIFAPVEIALGRKLRRYFWTDIISELERHRRNGGPR